MSASVQAVIFDCDGTLVDSEGPAIDVIRTMVGELGIPLTLEQAHTHFLGVRMAECMRWIGSQLTDKPADFEATFMARVRQATEVRFHQGLQAMPGAAEILSRLCVPFCVATNGPREKVELTLQLTGLRSYFGERIFCAYETGFFKPDPGLFLHAARTLGIDPAHCAVVEDSLPGIAAGLAAGMQVFSLYPVEQLPPDLLQRITSIECLQRLEDHLPLLSSCKTGSSF